MNDIFLNSELKLYYMEDFKRLLQCDIDFWKIDNDFLKGVLETINSNSKVQTLYSKYNDPKKIESESYLQFAYTKDIEDELFRSVIPSLLITYSYKYKLPFYYKYCKPKENPNYQHGREKFGFNFVDDPNFFMINRMKICVVIRDDSIRKDFWLNMQKRLSEL